MVSHKDAAGERDRKIDEAVKENYYNIQVVCSNCNQNNFLPIPKGTTVGEVYCPNCSCKTLRRYP